ncbi:Erv1 / Alr family protein [Besnoitia besnoiti]|uniref:Sulfhydryl oxidase n=1 Tax=Besnoitia besnoiti TaxID=94643 RepID=A0A2A9MQ23_BESBE|nr:Erv1 / Alr family protein [Besnoitia besnoiti]PFH38536.1 Erv1 / Alr family protein [Besnoitia besnoiti]
MGNTAGALSRPYNYAAARGEANGADSSERQSPTRGTPLASVESPSLGALVQDNSSSVPTSSGRPGTGTENRQNAATPTATKTAESQLASPVGGNLQCAAPTPSSSASLRGSQQPDACDSHASRLNENVQASADSYPPIHFCADTNEPRDPCNAQWLLLWTYAAYASPRPSMEEQRHLRVFFEEFPDQCTFGPAAGCYREAVKSFQPRVESRRDLMLWLCLVENQCRMKLDMPTRPCRYSELVRRWRYDDGYL